MQKLQNLFSQKTAQPNEKSEQPRSILQNRADCAEPRRCGNTENAKARENTIDHHCLEHQRIQNSRRWDAAKRHTRVGHLFGCDVMLLICHLIYIGPCQHVTFEKPKRAGVKNHAVGALLLVWKIDRDAISPLQQILCHYSEIEILSPL